MRVIAFVSPDALADTGAGDLTSSGPERAVIGGFLEKSGWPFTSQKLEGITFALARLRENELASVFNLRDGQVVALSSLGTDLPGWPVRVTFASTVSMMPSAVDFDSDGLEEVIVPLRDLHALTSAGIAVPGWPLLAPEGNGLGVPVAAGRFGGGGAFRAIGTQADPNIGNMSLVQVDAAAGDVPGWPVAVGTFPTVPRVAVGDITGDGIVEIVATVSSTGGQNAMGLVAAYDLQGNSLPGFPISIGFTLREPTLGDIDGDGALDICFGGGRIVPDGVGTQVGVLHADGRLAAGWPQSGGGGSNFGVALGDVDGDGRLELATSTVNAPDGRVNLWNHDGTFVPGWPIFVDDVSFFNEAVIADVSGDGVGDIIASGVTGPPFSGVVYAWQTDGTLVSGFPIEIPGRPVFSAPNVADIDQDGMAEIGFMTENGLFSVFPSRVHWFDLGVPYRPEGMEWPTRAHDMARTGAYSPPVNRVGMRVRVIPPFIADFFPINRYLVTVKIPAGEEARPTQLSLVSVDGEEIANPIPGEFLKATNRRGRQRAGGKRLIFRFQGDSIREAIGASGLHTLGFQTELVGGLGGTVFEGDAWVIAIKKPSFWHANVVGKAWQ